MKNEQEIRNITLESKPFEIKINGKIYRTEADNAEIMEKVIAFDSTVAAIGAELQKGKDTIQKIKELCTACVDAADSIFGKDSGKTIFGQSVNFTKCVQFAQQVLPALTAYYNDLAKEMVGNG